MKKPVPISEVEFAEKTVDPDLRNPQMRAGGKNRSSDHWIGLREKILDKLSGMKEDTVLNTGPAESLPENGQDPDWHDPAAELKRALTAIKTDAMDPSSGKVDYGQLRSSPAYQGYRQTISPGLQTFDPAIFKTRPERLAFWINLYNALVMDAVIALGIQRSVTEGKLGMLTFFHRAAYNLGGHRICLDDIEDGILRENRGHPYLPGRQFSARDPRLSWVIYPPEPRVHFALNCASLSCPPIEVYSAADLEAQLDMATRNYLEANLKIHPTNQVLVLPEIFRWFGGDFGGREGIIQFILQHLPFDARRAWLSKNREAIKIRYATYDWGLNSQEPVS